MHYKSEIAKNGFVIVENLFDHGKIQEWRNEIETYINHNSKLLKSSGGISIPDFVSKNDFLKLSSIRFDSKLLDILREILGDSFRFCEHNDIGINRTVGWHKDKLNGKYAKYETVNIWEKHNDEKHEIVKVLIYLQDHSTNNGGLQVIPKSHLVRSVQTNGAIQLHPKLGDVIIFDQRITHRGSVEHDKNHHRILVSFGFGKNNIFTDNFEKGTIQRQNEQNGKV